MNHGLLFLQQCDPLQVQTTHPTACSVLPVRAWGISFTPSLPRLGTTAVNRSLTEGLHAQLNLEASMLSVTEFNKFRSKRVHATSKLMTVIAEFLCGEPALTKRTLMFLLLYSLFSSSHLAMSALFMAL
mmetsp:Transcript_6464/g.20121  ORF Transcript_6464/g.20121 Transcript_6464/m.20121 type:complete len:129 (+) Transcript_6464:132-518(+)